jgi:hypothetical protein
MAKFDPAEEERIQVCFTLLRENPKLKKKKLARQQRVLYDKLRRRIQGVPDRTAAGGHNKALTLQQENGLKRYLSYLIHIGQPPTKTSLRAAGNKIREASGYTGDWLGSNWATRWMTKNRDLFKTI